MIRIFSLLALILSTAPAALSTDWVVDQTASEIRFSGSHAGSEFEGSFEEWTAAITFDPANIGEASVDVTINTASARTGNTMYDGTLTAEDWFHVAEFKTARFTANQFKPLSNGKFEATGTLTIREVSKPVSLIFALEIGADQAKMTATHTMNRLDFKLGATSDPSADWVSKEIGLAITVTASAE